MPELTIRLKRHPDGDASLTCVRADGSTTWQRQRGSLGLVFPPHDLTHYAVETTLGYRRGFYGLIADGWDIGDFAKPWPRGDLPLEAVEVELVVGCLDAERMGVAPMTGDEFREHARRCLEARRAAHPGKRLPEAPAIGTAQLARVRARRAELLERWLALAPGEALELPFDRV